MQGLCHLCLLTIWSLFAELESHLKPIPISVMPWPHSHDSKTVLCHGTGGQPNAYRFGFVPIRGLQNLCICVAAQSRHTIDSPPNDLICVWLSLCQNCCPTLVGSRWPIACRGQQWHQQQAKRHRIPAGQTSFKERIEMQAPAMSSNSCEARGPMFVPSMCACM